MLSTAPAPERDLSTAPPVPGLDNQEDSNQYLAGVERGVCLKYVSARGVGKVARDCAADEERQLGVCYPRRAAGEHGVGPLCWASCALPSVSMGPLCCDTTEDCTRLLEEAAKLVYDVSKAAVDRESPAEMIDDLKALITDAKGFACPSVPRRNLTRSLSL